MDMVLIVLMNFEKHDINIQLTIAHDFAYKYKKNDTHNCKMFQFPSALWAIGIVFLHQLLLHEDLANLGK